LADFLPTCTSDGFAEKGGCFNFVVKKVEVTCGQRHALLDASSPLRPKVFPATGFVLLASQIK